MEDFRNLNYDNEFGSFSTDGSEYWIRQSKKKRIPVAWSNILTNDKFGSVITDTMGGYTWYINSQTNRITPFDNDSFTDKSYEKIYVKCKDSKSDGEAKYNQRAKKEQKTKNEEKYFYTCFGFGYAKHFDDFDNVQKEIDVFVPVEDSAKIYIINLENKSLTDKDVTIKYDINWQMADSKEHSIIFENYKENVNIIEASNFMNNKYIAYICSSEKQNKNKEIAVKIKPNEKKEVLIALGVEEKEENIINVVTKIISNHKEEFEKTKKYWKDKVSRIKASTPMKSFDVMQNGWLCYQTLASRMIAKTGYYQSSGGYGFRDQMQDAMGMKWVNPDILKNQIIYNAEHQFYEGDVEHWWHEDSKLGIRSRYSDDMLWLPYAVLEYIDFTGDYGILKERASFINAESLKPDENDRVDFYKKNEGNNINFAPYQNGNATISYNNTEEDVEKTDVDKENASIDIEKTNVDKENVSIDIEKTNIDIEDASVDRGDTNARGEDKDEFSIFAHCIKSIQTAWELGEHDIPLIKNGDWNDGMNKIGNGGKGESVWLGFFLYDILTRFIEIIEYTEKNARIKNISKDMSIGIENKKRSVNESVNVNENESVNEGKDGSANGSESVNENVNKSQNEGKNESVNCNWQMIKNENINEIKVDKTKPTQIGEWNYTDYGKLKNEFSEKASKIKKSLNSVCWDGRWFLRAFDDKGNKIGSNENEECKIDSISQSFSVISNAGDNDKKIIAMQSLENYLIDDKNNVVELLTPPLQNTDLGYISSYARGMRENGGQYTHAAIWAMIAEIMLGRKEQAMRIYNKVNPVEHTTNIDKLLKYKVEPYVVAGDIYSEGNLAGRGGWTWYTGSSAWLYETQIRYILGIKIYHGKMEIHPCVPDNWEQFNVDFKWKDAEYLLKYRKTGRYKIQVFEVDKEKWKKEDKCNRDVFDNKNEMNYDNEIEGKNELNYEIEDTINGKIELKNKGNYIINVMF